MLRSFFRLDADIGPRKDTTLSDLLTWWHSEFTEEEQEYILSKYLGPMEVNIDLEKAEFDEEGQEYTLEIDWGRDETPLLDNLILPNGSLGRVEYLSRLATWFSSPKEDLPLARRIMAKAVELGEGESGPILDRHFIYHSMIKVYYSDRARDEDTLWLAVEACEKQIKLAPAAAKAWIAEYPEPPRLPEHLGFKQLAIICEKEKSYASAIALSQEALSQGWSGDWQKRIDRCTRRLSG